MKIFQFFAALALVQAASAATHEKDEFHKANEEMAEMTHRMTRHLREGKGNQALKEHAKNMRHVQEGKQRLDAKRPEKHAANAEKIRKVADGVKKQQRDHMDPRMKHKMESAKLSNHSKAGMDGDTAAKREKAAVNAESMRKMTKQIPKQLNQAGAAEGEKFVKTLPDVKTVANGIKESAARPKKVTPGSIAGAREKIDKMSKNIDAEEGEDGEE